MNEPEKLNSFLIDLCFQGSNFKNWQYQIKLHFGKSLYFLECRSNNKEVVLPSKKEMAFFLLSTRGARRSEIYAYF